jgi:signal transduction histidine kinase
LLPAAGLLTIAPGRARTILPAWDATHDEPPRESILRRVLYWFAIGALLNGCVLLFHAAQHAFVRPELWVFLLGLQTAGLLIGLHKRLGYQRTAWLTLAHLFVLSTYFQLFRGPTPGTVLASVSFLLLSGLFFGGRGMIWACALLFLSLIVSAALILSHALEPWPDWFWDPLEPVVWLRYALVFACYGGAVAMGLLLTVSGLERTAASLRETLERERIEHTRLEVVQRELEQSKRLEALGQFAAGVAHDFNNNLSVIMASAALLEDPDGAENAQALGAEITRSAQVAADTVRQLLSLGKKGSGAPQQLTLFELLRHSMSTLRHALGPRVELTLEGNEEAQVFVDGGRFRQALLNLAINARDAMPEGGHWRLRVTERELQKVPAGWSAQPGAFVALECRDDGSGIRPELIDKIFEPFFTTKPSQQGSGLGLAMVHKTMLEAHGFIEVESRVGVGTTFQLCLPRSAT